MSRACSGIGVLPMDVLDDCCAVLKCKAADIYDAAALLVLYQNGQAEEKKQPSTICVRIKKEVAELVDALVDDGTYISRNEAVNGLLRGALL